jgi:heme-degrading monooxygenase HmoA
MATPDNRALELVVFRLKDGVARERLIDTAGAVSIWLGEQPGFISRELLHDAEGDRWIDLVWWETMNDARAAAAAALTAEACAPMFSLIDGESTLMVHGAPAT